jgi:hypothetical protein
MIHALIIFGLALVYALLKIYFEKRLAPLDDVGDERHLADLAFTCGCSVFDLFRLAGAQWNFSEQKIDADFRRYLMADVVPPYVSAYLREHRQQHNNTYHRLLYNGGRPPYL